MQLLRYEDVCGIVLTKGDNEQTVREIVRDLPYGEVIVWDNSHSDVDLKIYGRYAAAETSTRPVVYFQDDDVRFHNHDDLLANYTPGVLVSNMYDEWIESMQYFDLAMVGLGSICDNGLWDDAFARWRNAYPSKGLKHDERILLDPDFIFGVLAKWRRFDFGHEILELASDPSRLSLQPGQHERKYETITMARKLRTVVLTMMAKNEAHQIERAMQSTLGWYDSVVLLDTGSTDDTQDVVTRFCIEHDLSLFSTQEEFTTFREMRNRLIELGRTRGDYMLLMDADEEWVNLPTERPELIPEAFMVHYEGSVDWAQPRLLASRFPWKWTGPTHSYLDSDWEGECLAVDLGLAPMIVHHGDMRHGNEKTLRDIEILEREIAQTDYDLPRNLFMLGKAYEGLDNDKAMDYYRRRIALDHLDPEDYWCRFRLGVLLSEHTGDFGASIETLWEAHKSRPQRVEALRALAFYCTAVADVTPYPRDDITLVVRDMYRV